MRIPWVFGKIVTKPAYRLSVYRPNFADRNVRTTFALILVVLSALFMSGFIYAAINLPPAVIRVESGAGYIARDINSQTSMEVLIMSMVTLFGVFGGYLLRRSVGKLMEEEEMSFWLGIVLMGLAFLMSLIFLYKYKLARYLR